MGVALLQKRLGALAGLPTRRVCAKARPAMWQVHIVQHPNAAFGVDAHIDSMKHGGKRCRSPWRRPP